MDTDRLIWTFLYGTVLVLVSLLFFEVLGAVRDTSPPEATLTSVPAADAAAITTAGVLEVGRDVQPGTYQAYAPPGCHWAVLAPIAFDGDDEAKARAGGGRDGGAIAVRLTRDDVALVTVGCGNWVAG